MRIRSSDLGCAALVLAALLATDGALAATGFPLAGPDAARLSAQEAEERSRLDEERMFLEARRALNREEFDRAAELFAALRFRYRNGRFNTDSYYWEAFGRHRQGNLEEALLLLDLARVQSDANTFGDRMFQEVREFRLRIQRQLAERGDPDAAEAVLRQSEALLSPDTAAISEAHRQFDEQLRNARARWQEEQAAFQREVERDLERRRARLDSLNFWGTLPERPSAVELAARRRELMAQEVMARRELAGLARADTAGTLTADSLPATAWLLAPEAFGIATGIPLHTIPQGCDDALIQQEALTSLLRLETDRMPTVRDVLGRDDACSAHLRQLAVNWLRAQRTEEAEGLLTEVATSHPDNRTRRAAVTSLSRFEGSDVTEALVNILRDSDDQLVQGAAINGLSDRRSDDATQVLVDFAADGDMSLGLRVAAAVHAAQRLDPASFTTVFNRLNTEQVQFAFLSALAAPGEDGQGDASWLLTVVMDQEHSGRVRDMALQAWARQPTLDLELVKETYGSLESADLRDQLLYALYQRAEGGAEAEDAIIDTMIELARGETDPEVRKRAVYWLGRTGSERAAAFLMEILRQSPTTRPGG